MGDAGIPATTLAMERLLSHYGHVMDRADWDALGEIFAEHAVCDWSDFGLETTTSLRELQDYFAKIRHPAAHHVTNVVVDLHDPSHATIHSKLLVVLDDGTTVSGDYVDDAELLDVGWRIVHRIATKRPRRSDRSKGIT